MQLLWKAGWQFLKQLKEYSPAISLLGIYPKDDWKCTLRRDVYSSLVCNSLESQTTQMPINIFLLMRNR